MRLASWRRLHLQTDVDEFTQHPVGMSIKSGGAPVQSQPLVLGPQQATRLETTQAMSPQATRMGGDHRKKRFHSPLDMVG